MLRRTIAPLALLALGLGLGGCGKRQQQEAAKGETRADTNESARTGTPLDTAPRTAPTPQNAAPPVIRAVPPAGSQRSNNAIALVGSWDLSPPAGLRSPHLTMVIDSARRSTFYGTLTRALSGDMELSGNFEPFKGTVDTAGLVRITIAPSQKGSPPARIEGHLETDRLRLSSFVWGDEEQVRPDKGWEFRKKQ